MASVFPVPTAPEAAESSVSVPVSPPSSSGDKPGAPADALSTAFPLYQWCLRILLRWNLAEAKRPAYKSRLVIILCVAWLCTLVFALINKAIYGRSHPDAMISVLMGSVQWVAAPLFGAYISGWVLPQLADVQPQIRSYLDPRHNQLYRLHRRFLNVSLCFPMVGMVLAAVGCISTSISAERYNWPAALLINYILNALMLVVIAGGLGPIAFTVYLFVTLVHSQGIHTFKQYVTSRDLCILEELDPTTPAERRLILAVPPPPPPPMLGPIDVDGYETGDDGNNSETEGNIRDPESVENSARGLSGSPMHSSSNATTAPAPTTLQPPAPQNTNKAGAPGLSLEHSKASRNLLNKTSLSKTKSMSGADHPVTVDEVLRLQRAMQRLVSRHSVAWQLPLVAVLVVAILAATVAALNIITGANTQVAFFIWMCIGPAMLFLVLAPAVTLNTAWTSLLTSPDIDWRRWRTSERSWLTSRFALAPVTFPIAALSFDWPSLIKLIATSLAPLVVSQALSFKNSLQESVANKSL